MDGTLADRTHRLHLIDKSRGKPDWFAFHKRCVDDQPIYPVINVFRALQERNLIWIWSGRHEYVRKETMDWIRKHMGQAASMVPIMMRPNDNTEPDEELKERWLRETTFRPNIVFDDRQKVVDMWRRNGIICAQVATGDF